MSKFSELSAKLDKELADVHSKKDKMDHLSKELTHAADAYNKAVETAKVTRGQLETELNDAMGKDLKAKIG